MPPLLYIKAASVLDSPSPGLVARFVARRFLGTALLPRRALLGAGFDFGFGRNSVTSIS